MSICEFSPPEVSIPVINPNLPNVDLERLRLNLQLAELQIKDLNIPDFELRKLQLNLSLYSEIGINIPDASLGLDKLRKALLKATLNFFNDQFTQILFGKRTPGNKKNKKRVQSKKGVVEIVDTLYKIDLCAVLNAIANPFGTSTFDPNPNPIPVDPKWKIQKLAYDTKSSVDELNANYGTDITKVPKPYLTDFLSSLSVRLDKLLSADYLGNQAFLQAYPISKIAKNTVQEFNTYLQQSVVNNVSSLTTAQLEKLQQKLNILKSGCDSIVALSNPVSLIGGTTNSFLSPNSISGVRELNKILVPGENLLTTLKGILENVKIIDTVSSSILRIVNLMQNVIKIIQVIVKVLKIVSQFLLVLPIPSVFTTVGIGTTFSSLYQKLNTKLSEIIITLAKINATLSLMSLILENVVCTLNVVIPRLEAIIAGLKPCVRPVLPILAAPIGQQQKPNLNSTPNTQNQAINELVTQLENQVANLKSSRSNINDFLTNYQNKKQSQLNTYGAYTIKILTEEIADQQVYKNTIPRRYGVALDNNNEVVVKSTPTFASSDTVIRDEVKLLLASKGVQNADNVFSSEDLDVLNESNNYLYEDSTSFDDIQANTDYGLDSPNNENEDSRLGINAFVNKLKGGKKLRNRMRKAMADQKTKLNSDLQKTKK